MGQTRAQLNGRTVWLGQTLATFRNTFPALYYIATAWSVFERKIYGLQNELWLFNYWLFPDLNRKFKRSMLAQRCIQYVCFYVTKRWKLIIFQFELALGASLLRPWNSTTTALCWGQMLVEEIDHFQQGGGEGGRSTTMPIYGECWFGRVLHAEWLWWNRQRHKLGILSAGNKARLSHRTPKRLSSGWLVVLIGIYL